MAEETTQNPLAEGDGHAAWAKKMFDELDVDGSGQISVAELRTFLERTGKAMPYEEALAPQRAESQVRRLPAPRRVESQLLRLAAAYQGQVSPSETPQMQCS